MISKKKLLQAVSVSALSAVLAIGALTNAATVNAQAGINELTGLATTAPENQRPIAVMIDNDKRANPHYGLSEADVVYEMINSTHNNRVTRLMAVYKDYNSVSRIGNIRSTRPTNIMLAAEYNAVLIHDGGPFYIYPYFDATGLNHLSGGFSRIPNGKPREFTEYCTAGETASRMAKAGYPSAYTAYEGQHYTFGANSLADDAGVAVATNVSVPFPHNSTQFVYNAATGTYDYYEFGSPVVDGDDKQQVTFTNVFLQDCDFTLLDKNGYMVYNCIGTNVGYYLTGGMVIPVTWVKTTYTGATKFYTLDGAELVVNPGKTYIALVPSDAWGQVGIK